MSSANTYNITNVYTQIKIYTHVKISVTNVQFIQIQELAKSPALQVPYITSAVQNSM